MKKSASTPRKLSTIKVFPITPSRKNSTPMNLLGLTSTELKSDDMLSLKFKNQSQSCRASKKPIILKSARASLTKTARVSPKSNSTPVLYRSAKANPYEVKQPRPKALKSLIKLKRSASKDLKTPAKPQKNPIKDFVTQINLDVYDVPEKFLTNKEIKAKHQEIHKAHLLQTFHGLKIIEEIPKLDLNDISDKIITLPHIPGLQDKKTVIFDLDETLVHCVEGNKGDAEVVVRFPTGESLTVIFI